MSKKVYKNISTTYNELEAAFNCKVCKNDNEGNIPFIPSMEEKYIGRIMNNSLWICWMSPIPYIYPRVFFKSIIAYNDDNSISVVGEYKFDKKTIIIWTIIIAILAVLLLMTKEYTYRLVIFVFIVIYSLISILANKNNKKRIEDFFAHL